MPISSASGNPVASTVGADLSHESVMLCADGIYRQIDLSVPRPGSVLPAYAGGTGHTSLIALAADASMAAAYVLTVQGLDTTGVTDCSTLINAAITTATTTSKFSTVVLPRGTLKLTAPILPKNNVVLIGQGVGSTVLMPYGTATAIDSSSSASLGSPLTNFHVRDLELDGTNQSNGGVYTSNIKGTNMPFSTQCSWANIYIHDSFATGLGADHLVNCYGRNVLTYNCGRANSGSDPGGAGIGIGTGYHTDEPQVWEGCTTLNSGRCGIFFESQNGTRSKGIRVIGHYAANCGEHGIADAGASNLVVQGGQSAYNTGSGFAVYRGTYGTPSTGPNPGTSGQVIGLQCYSNNGRGIHLDFSSATTALQNYTVRGCKISNNALHGIHVAAGASQAVSGVYITDNEVWLNTQAGVMVSGSGAAVSDICIENNRVWNNGYSGYPGIDILTSVTRPTIMDNSCWDSQGSPTQTYGLIVGNAVTLTGGKVRGNDFRGNLTGTVNVIGTISATTAVVSNLGYSAPQPGIIGSLWLSGRWYPQFGVNGSALATVENTAYAIPFICGAEHTFSGIGVNATVGGGVGSVLRLSLYQDNGACYPGALITDYGTVTSTGTGALTITQNQLVSLGLVWLVVVPQVSASTPTLQTAAVTTLSAALLGLFGSSGAGSVSTANGYSLANAATGVMPATFPGSAGITGMGTLPIIQLAA